MIRQESQFSAFARSGKSAYGLMQILPSTAQMVNKKYSFKSNPRYLYDPKINVDTGSLYIKSLLNMKNINGDLLKALISYNAGPGNLSKWMKKTWQQMLLSMLLRLAGIAQRERWWRPMWLESRENSCA